MYIATRRARLEAREAGFLVQKYKHSFTNILNPLWRFLKKRDISPAVKRHGCKMDIVALEHTVATWEALLHMHDCMTPTFSFSFWSRVVSQYSVTLHPP